MNKAILGAMYVMTGIALVDMYINSLYSKKITYTFTVPLIVFPAITVGSTALATYIVIHE